MAKPRWSSVTLKSQQLQDRVWLVPVNLRALTKMVPWLGIPDTVDSQEHQLSHTQEQQAWAGPARVKGKS